MTFKKFAIGFAIFILTLLLIIFMNETINKKPKEPSYGSYYTPKTSSYEYDDDTYYQNQQTANQNARADFDKQMEQYKINSFITVMILSLLVIIAGVLIRSVPPVSYGLLFAGAVAIIYVLVLSYEEIGKPVRAIVTGLGLGLMIWLAYAKFPETTSTSPQQPTPTPSNPPPTPTPPPPAT